MLFFVKEHNGFNREDRFIRIKEKNVSVDVDVFESDLDQYMLLSLDDKNVFGVLVRSSLNGWVTRTLVGSSSLIKEDFEKKAFESFRHFLAEPLLRDVLYQEHFKHILSFKHKEKPNE